MSGLMPFLLARIAEDYEAECDGASTGSAVETAARIRANIRGMSLWGVLDGRLVPFAIGEAAKYADHPDYDEAWRP